MRRAAVAAGLLPDVGGQTHPSSDLSKAQVEFLRAFDVEYERRRIGFVRDGAAWLYGAGEAGWPRPRPDRRREARPLRARVGSRARVGHARRRRRPPSPGTRHVRRRGASGTPPARRVRPGLGSRDEAQRVRRRERLGPRGARDARASRAREGDGLLRRDDVHPPPRRARRLARGAASGAARGPAAQVHRVSHLGCDHVPAHGRARGRRARRPDRALPRQPARDADRAASRPHEAQARGHGHASFRRVLRPPGP